MPDLHSPSEWLRFIARNTKRIFVLLLGAAVLLAGVAMLALPGPGLLVIILGLVILATEFAWAESVLDRTTTTAAGAATKLTDNTSGKLMLAASGLGMIVGGVLVAVLFGGFRVVGASVALAGVIGLTTLIPAVQTWIEQKADT